MNPQLLQSIKLMELPVIDLRERIEQELERNPALEVVEDRSTVSLDDAETQRKEEYEYFEATSDPGLPRQGTDDHQRFIEGALSRPETLQEHLLWQLQLEPIDDELRAIAETLIQNLDADGFHKEPPETLFKSTDEQFVPPPRLGEAMELVRFLDPQGTCTADYHESLKVQIGLLYNAPAGIEKALDYLELLEREKFSELAQKIDMDKEEVRLFYDRVKELSPFPGRFFASAEVRYVIPDIQIVKDEGEFVIVLNKEAIPVLGINRFFQELNSQPDQAAAHDFVRENIREARVFIHQLNQRNLTLLRVVKAILDFQRPFFVDGPKRLAPLTLGDIARELGVHETTVSRTANGKYMQTEWGIFEIRYFFTNSISGAGSGGSQYSKEGVKAIIKEIISGENSRLSDQDISDLLDRRGIALARRTVAKYRKELDMGSSYTRRV